MPFQEAGAEGNEFTTLRDCSMSIDHRNQTASQPNGGKPPRHKSPLFKPAYLSSSSSASCNSLRDSASLSLRLLIFSASPLLHGLVEVGLTLADFVLGVEHLVFPFFLQRGIGAMGGDFAQGLFQASLLIGVAAGLWPIRSG